MNINFVIQCEEYMNLIQNDDIFLFSLFKVDFFETIILKG